LENLWTVTSDYEHYPKYVRITNNSVPKMFSECLKNVNCTFIIFEVPNVTDYTIYLGL